MYVVVVELMIVVAVLDASAVVTKVSRHRRDAQRHRMVRGSLWLRPNDKLLKTSYLGTDHLDDIDHLHNLDHLQ